MIMTGAEESLISGDKIASFQPRCQVENMKKHPLDSIDRISGGIKAISPAKTNLFFW
jgi:hypothetical protein